MPWQLELALGLAKVLVLLILGVFFYYTFHRMLDMPPKISTLLKQEGIEPPDCNDAWHYYRAYKRAGLEDKYPEIGREYRRWCALSAITVVIGMVLMWSFS